MQLKLALGTMLAVALIAPAALPCGAPFGNGINVDPEQDIVVVHKNGTETYVFQPRFCGSAQQFGLILPVPAKLSAQPALSKPRSSPIWSSSRSRRLCTPRNAPGLEQAAVRAEA